MKKNLSNSNCCMCHVGNINANKCDLQLSINTQTNRNQCPDFQPRRIEAS